MLNLSKFNLTADQQQHAESLVSQYKAHAAMLRADGTSLREYVRAGFADDGLAMPEELGTVLDEVQAQYGPVFDPANALQPTGDVEIS